MAMYIMRLWKLQGTFLKVWWVSEIEMLPLLESDMQNCIFIYCIGHALTNPVGEEWLFWTGSFHHPFDTFWSTPVLHSSLADVHTQVLVCPELNLQLAQVAGCLNFCFCSPFWSCLPRCLVYYFRTILWVQTGCSLVAWKDRILFLILSILTLTLAV
jgi:hypothetical protein